MAIIKSDHPIIPLRDLVVFPGVVTTLFVGRAKSVEALNAAMSSDKKLVLVAQMDASKEDPLFTDMYHYGTVSNLLQLIKLPDGTMKVLVEGLKRCKIDKLIEEATYTKARDAEIEDIPVCYFKNSKCIDNLCEYGCAINFLGLLDLLPLLLLLDHY